MNKEDLYNTKALEMICPLYKKKYNDSSSAPCCNTCEYYTECIFIEIYIKLNSK